MFKYGNYIAKPEVDSEAGILYGKVLNISATITFQGENVREAEQSFRNAVDLYIQTCKEQGKEPEKPFSGKLPFRTSPDIHRDIYMAATHANKSINAWMEEILSHAARQVERRFSSAEGSQAKTGAYETSIPSVQEYEQFLSRLERKVIQLQEAVKSYLDKKPGSFEYFLKAITPFLEDEEFPLLLQKVRAFDERLKSIQSQKASPIRSLTEGFTEVQEVESSEEAVNTEKSEIVFGQ